MGLFGFRKRESPFGDMTKAGQWFQMGLEALPHVSLDLEDLLKEPEPRNVEIEKLKKAIHCFTKAIKLVPYSDVFYTSRGDAYCELENYEQATSDYNRAIELNPDEPRNYLGRGKVYYNKKEYKKAWGDVYKAQKLGYCENIPFLEDLLAFMENERWGKVEKI